MKQKDLEIHSQIHHGRREKLRNTFKRYGLETFNETQVLEFALGMVIPRIDTNPTAHRLINTFGSLDGVTSASPDKLQKIEGVGAQAATFLHFLKQFVTYMMGIERESKKITSPTDAVSVLRGLMATYPVEHFIVVCLDKRGNVLLHQDIRGDVDKVNINIRDVVDIALRVQSVNIVFAHNHLSDNIQPSDPDIRLTRSLVGVLSPLGVNIIDHIIFGETGQFSFSLSGILDILKREHIAYKNSTDYEDIIDIKNFKNFKNSPK